jgi:hypothetical protein
VPDLIDLPPAQRWVDLDPTNDRAGWPSPGEDYVTLAIGRDFSDVSPLRGVIHGGASHTLQVGVTVEPVPDKVTRPAELSTDVAGGQSQTQTQVSNSGQGQSQGQGQGAGRGQSNFQKLF